MNDKKVHEFLGRPVIKFTEWQYETRDFKIGRVRNYSNGMYTASYFDGEDWVQVMYDDTEEWTTPGAAYLALANALETLDMG